MPLLRVFRAPVWDGPAAENKVQQLNSALKQEITSATLVPRVLEVASEWVFYGDMPGCDSWDSLSADGKQRQLFREGP